MELLDRVLKCFKERNIEPYWIEHYHENSNWKTIPEFTLDVYQTYRINHHTLDNVTVTIEVAKWNQYSGHRIAKIKVPKDASDKVINNRIDKAIECMKEST